MDSEIVSILIWKSTSFRKFQARNHYELLSQNVEEAFLSCKTIQCEQCCIANGKTFIFHLLIIRSVSGVLHICESKCFILWNDSGTMLHLKRRFMKYGFAVWSTFCACELCSSSIKIYEAPLDSGMKRSLDRLHVFLQIPFLIIMSGANASYCGVKRNNASYCGV